jgi:VanZ family protein
MSPAPTATREFASDSIVTRGRLALAAGVFATLVSYASLVPLDARALSAQQAWALLAASWPPAITSKTDLVANFVLQFPLGFLLAGAISHRQHDRQGIAVLLATVAVGLLSFSIEFAQGMFAVRTPSTTDVVAESLGALAGALLWRRAGETIGHIFDYGWRELGSPALLLLGVYLTVWALWQWMPFDFTLRLPELAHKYRAGLRALWPAAPDAEGVLLTLRPAARQWLLSVPVGAMGWLLTRQRRRRRVDAAILAGCGLALSVQAAGLTTISGSFDVAAISAAGLGAAAGAWWVERPAGYVGALAVGALLVDQWAPFQFAATPQTFSAVPLLSYVLASPSQAVSEVLLKLLLGFATAFAATLSLARAELEWKHVAWWVAVCVAIEAGQLFLPGRFADVTDVLLLTSGAAAGLATHAVFQHERAAPHGPAQRVMGGSRSRRRGQ